MFLISCIGCNDVEKVDEETHSSSVINDISKNNQDSSYTTEPKNHQNNVSSSSSSSKQSVTTSSEITVSEENKNSETKEELSSIDKLRPDYDLGNCRNLEGNIAVIIFYMDDFESSWTPEEINNFTENEIKPGLKFLEDSAVKFNKQLNLDIKEVHSSVYYNDEVEVNIKKSGYATGDALYTAAKHLGYKGDNDFITNYKKKYSTEVICYCVFNKSGNSYALNPKRGTNSSLAEHVLMFAYDLNPTGMEPIGCQSSVLAHETLHLYGAEDYYSPADRKILAKKYCPNDIMLSCNYYLRMNTFGEITAFYIGWTDSVPDLLYDENW